MKEQLLKLKTEAVNRLKECKDNADIEKIRVKYLGKKGDLTLILRSMGNLSKEERPEMGKLANEVRSIIEEEIKTIKEYVSEKDQQKKIKSEMLDITFPGKVPEIGRRHPLIQVKEELESVFMRMGYDVISGPEIETVGHNFDDLNAPYDHPSRDKSDTFYISDDLVLRTQTSPVQIRVMKEGKLPIRMVCTGRTFRFDDVDDTHSPMFHQMECLVVDKGVTLANLKDSIDQFVKELFGSKVETRFRPHNFPFTEPSAEVDVSCHLCMGKGCPACHGTGWSMELLGCGMVHPNVLRNCGIDPEVYSGYAFGMGIDRVTMVKYGIPNIRLLFENDVRFLKQF
ncbi:MULTISPECIES: phenylalanine--tRNA ligase subunit alpha [unclassified Sedimentibacter]|uniref:phenylalanine--tRNA ligase subunit alpha n=1 Tax=unclassified Sedimentibacter TaxID=2649220 RepID=UPI0027E1019C|nr:phenylalanine--tRNA ligase subunit alpha [Sedimentibacter sp. MB35-C1]WMJ76737.1 phenylalanine--tRNA ligase subunit alpha [Sedimentibacter sp. MB35-C1]